MKKILKSHCSRIIKNPLSKIVLSVLIIIPIFDIIQILYEQRENPEKLIPYTALFLNGITTNHLFQIILLWFLPIYLLLIVGDDVIQDYDTGYRNILICNYGKKVYIQEKLLTSFIISFLAVFISLLINFILVHIVFIHGTYNMFDFEPTNLVEKLGAEHPYITVVLFNFITCILAGLGGMLGTAFSMLFHNRKIAYASTTLIWFLLICKKKSLVFIMQPFAEYDFNILIPIFAKTLILIIGIVYTVYIFEVKNDEI